MARTVAPSLISYTEVSYATADATPTITLASASVSWQTGDVLVVAVAEGDNNTIGVPTAPGLTFTGQKGNQTTSTAAGRLATAVATSTSSGAVSCVVTRGPGTNSQCGMSVWVWRGSQGVGSSVEQHTATKTVTITPMDTHSAFSWIVIDFTTGAATATLTPAPTTTQEAAVQSFYTVYAGNLNDKASADAVGIGITGGPATGPYTILAQEILGSEAGAPAPLTNMRMKVRTRG